MKDLSRKEDLSPKTTEVLAIEGDRVIEEDREVPTEGADMDLERMVERDQP